MRIIDDVVVYSPTDITAAADCSFATLRRLDEKLGRTDPIKSEPDKLLERVSRLGDEYEEHVLGGFVDRFGLADGPVAQNGVVKIDYSYAGGVDALVKASESTVAALREGADVVFQATFFDGRFNGFADFLLKQSDSDGGSQYRVADTKLARHAKVSALLQIAAYADQLKSVGVPVAAQGELILGDGSRTLHDIERIVPVYREQRRSLEAMLDAHQAAGSPILWGTSGVRACGRCDLCQMEVEAHRDVLLVAGMRMTQRAKLNDAGIETIDELAASSGSVPRMTQRTLEAIRAQATLQVQQIPSPDPSAVDAAEGESRPAGTPTEPQSTTMGNDPSRQMPVFEVFNPEGLSQLPTPSPGDIFFDFEGDPMWRDPVSGQWGLEYLFGLVEASSEAGLQPNFRAFWAHDRAEEKVALRDFLDYVAQRRLRWPDMHIYHYASYEKTALLRLAARYALGEDEVDDLLRQHVLVDLYPIVRSAVRVGKPSYSLKQLESFYMPADRSGQVTTAGDSVVEYEEYCLLQDKGDHDEAQRKLGDIAEYNKYDCESTLGLRDWLLGLAPDRDHDSKHPAGQNGPNSPDDTGISDAASEERATTEPLFAFANDHGPQGRSQVQTAVALISAAVGFFRREDKPFWWGHYERLSTPVEEWADSRDVIVADGVRVIQDWAMEGRQRVNRRVLELTGTMQPGCSLEKSKEVFLLYDNPPDGMDTSGGSYRGHSSGENLTVVSTSGDDRTTLRVTEKQPGGCTPYADLPMAVAPQAGPRTGSLRAAVAEIAQQTLAALDRQKQDPSNELELPGPAADLLLRRPPKLVAGGPLPAVVDGDFVPTITRAVATLDGSTLAVQGPPGTGKTYVGARVIARLVEEGWRIGVVSQGHAVINQLLDEVVKVGVPPERVGKKGRPEASTWTDVQARNYQAFLSETGGRVLGGTAWDFTNLQRVQRNQLDLLVIDEAGQYSLAMTLAVSVAAKRLLLLGDPQQLPQVSQGQHPESVDESALGWISEGQTLKPELGYFLDQTYRMSPALTERVSRHSYEGRLRSKEPEATERRMTDNNGGLVESGVSKEVVSHHGNSVVADEEADRVVELAQESMTWTWQDDPQRPARLMQQEDLLVVAPYNAQVDLIKRRLKNAGLPEVRVGTVDRFQGKEAPVVLVSMTASAPEDVPRGMDFLMSPNRLNVAVSRGKWRATIVASTALTGYTPSTPSGLADLGGFLGLTA